MKTCNLNPYKISNEGDILLSTLEVQKANSGAKMQTKLTKVYKEIFTVKDTLLEIMTLEILWQTAGVG